VARAQYRGRFARSAEQKSADIPDRVLRG